MPAPILIGSASLAAGAAAYAYHQSRRRSSLAASSDASYSSGSSPESPHRLMAVSPGSTASSFGALAKSAPGMVLWGGRRETFGPLGSIRSNGQQQQPQQQAPPPSSPPLPTESSFLQFKLDGDATLPSALVPSSPPSAPPASDSAAPPRTRSLSMGNFDSATIDNHAVWKERFI
ncbi:hypothetical protein HKX48_003216 [Thoreauomyces humboldtii]|nr:hypothetical protein HKX48_003216 [Thoreauomyces humboldtii]